MESKPHISGLILRNSHYCNCGLVWHGHPTSSASAGQYRGNDEGDGVPSTNPTTGSVRRRVYRCRVVDRNNHNGLYYSSGMPGSLEEKTAVVTGSSGGIGFAIAQHLVTEGANVVVNSRSQERADAAAEEIDGGDTVLPIEADVTDHSALRSLADRTVDEFGSLDIWVNNAGINIRGPAEEFSLDDWQTVIDVNLTGTFVGAQVAGNRMIDQGTGGSIINISSMMGEQGQTGRTPYNTSKGGVNNLTRSLAVEWADHDIQVNAVAPGYIETKMVDDAQDQIGFDKQDVVDRTPLGRLGSVDEVANCVTFLAEGNHFMTGEILHPDGGWLAFGWGSKD